MAIQGPKAFFRDVKLGGLFIWQNTLLVKLRITKLDEQGSEVGKALMVAYRGANGEWVGTSKPQETTFNVYCEVHPAKVEEF